MDHHPPSGDQLQFKAVRYQGRGIRFKILPDGSLIFQNPDDSIDTPAHDDNIEAQLQAAAPVNTVNNRSTDSRDNTATLERLEQFDEALMGTRQEMAAIHAEMRFGFLDIRRDLAESFTLRARDTERIIEAINCSGVPQRISNTPLSAGQSSASARWIQSWSQPRGETAVPESWTDDESVTRKRNWDEMVVESTEDANGQAIKTVQPEGKRRKLEPNPSLPPVENQISQLLEDSCYSFEGLNFDEEVVGWVVAKAYQAATEAGRQDLAAVVNHLYQQCLHFPKLMELLLAVLDHTADGSQIEQFDDYISLAARHLGRQRAEKSQEDHMVDRHRLVESDRTPGTQDGKSTPLHGNFFRGGSDSPV